MVTNLLFYSNLKLVFVNLFKLERSIMLEEIIRDLKAIQEIVMLRFAVLILPFAMVGVIWASEKSVLRPLSLFWVVLAVITARNAGMLLDRYIDRNIDSKNDLTKERAIPQKRVSMRSVWVMIVLNIIIMAFSAYNLNSLCLYLSPVAVLFLVLYPYMKRYTFFSHFFLGLVLSLAPLGAWVAIKGSFGLVSLLLALSVVFWVAGFDIMYHLEDTEFYIKENLCSIPRRLGWKKSRLLSILLYFLSVLLMLWAGEAMGLSSIYFVGVMLGACALVYQQYFFREPKPLRKNREFLLSNMLYSLSIFLFVFIEHIL